MEVNIIKMSEGHIKPIAAIEAECFSSPWSENSLREELSNDTAVFIAAEYDGKVVGYAGMNCIVDIGYIDNIAVTADFRRCGIGKKLLHRLITCAEDKGMQEITLEVRPSNTVATRFYSSFGFEIVGKRHNFYTKPTEDGFIMTKRLK